MRRSTVLILPLQLVFPAYGHTIFASYGTINFMLLFCLFLSSTKRGKVFDPKILSDLLECRFMSKCNGFSSISWSILIKLYLNVMLTSIFWWKNIKFWQKVGLKGDFFEVPMYDYGPYGPKYWSICIPQDVPFNLIFCQNVIFLIKILMLTQRLGTVWS